MKKTFFIVNALLLVLLMGCSYSINSGAFNAVQGSGNVVTEQRDVSGITEVELLMHGSLSIEQTDDESLTLEGEDNILALVETRVRAGRLSIGLKDNTNIRATKPLRFRLAVKDIAYIGDMGSGEVTMQELSTNSLTAEANGSGSIQVNKLSASKGTARILGSGNVSIAGRVERLEVSTGGSGGFKGWDLQSRNAKITSAASGGAVVRVSDTLDASTSGSGSIEYIGTPTVTKSETGSGRVRQLSDK